MSVSHGPQLSTPWLVLEVILYFMASLIWYMGGLGDPKIVHYEDC